MYYFLLPSSKIRDATFLFNEEGKNIIVIMSSAGYMYTQMMDESSSAQHGPFYVTNVLEINHEDLKVLQWFIFLYSQIDCSKLTKWIQNGLSVTACWVCCVFASQDSNGQVAGGGVSVYYSHVLQMLFFSYSQGKSLLPQWAAATWKHGDSLPSMSKGRIPLPVLNLYRKVQS